MQIQMVLKNKLGEFLSEIMTVDSDQYKGMVEISKKFYLSENGFEMWMENGFMVVSPEITRKSILLINIIEYDNDEKQI